MAMAQSLAAGYNVGRSMTDPNQRRSYMPLINTLGQQIAQRRARRGRGRTVVAATGGLDRAAADRERRDQAEKLEQEEKYRYEMDRLRQERQDDEARQLREGEEARRQEVHEAGLARAEMESGIAQRKSAREERQFMRQEAYDQAKQGLMMGNAALVEDALMKLMPEGAGDVITRGTTEEGVTKVTARPGAREVPKFTFHPDGYVGVTFPGQKKPVVFQDAQDAFTKVIAPMSPSRYQTTGARPQDAVAERKNVREAKYKRDKLQADIHADAHEAAMQQFEADGYYQPALYNEEKYWNAYNSYVERATGAPPPRAKQQRQGGGIPKQYMGEDPPEGFPNARRGPRGGWYVQKKGKWYPVLEQNTEAPAAKEPKASPPGPRGPGRKPMPTAETLEMEAAGLRFQGPKEAEAAGKQPYRGNTPPPQYPDAQYDPETGGWLYFDSATSTWKEVMI